MRRFLHQVQVLAAFKCENTKKIVARHRSQTVPPTLTHPHPHAQKSLHLHLSPARKHAHLHAINILLKGVRFQCASLDGLHGGDAFVRGRSDVLRGDFTVEGEFEGTNISHRHRVPPARRLDDRVEWTSAAVLDIYPTKKGRTRA
jgi:hypothetical protein